MNTIIKICLPVFPYLLWSCVYAQPVIFQKDFFFSGDDMAECIQSEPDGGYVWSGVINGKAGIGKMDALGNMLWAYNYSLGLPISSADYIERTYDGGYMAVGSVYTTGWLNQNYVLYKLDSSGNLQWCKEYIPVSTHVLSAYNFWTASDFGLISVRGRETPDSGFVLIGQIYDSLFLSSWFQVIKTDPAGDVQWSRYYNLNYKSELYEIENVRPVDGEDTTYGFILTAEIVDSLSWFESLLLTRLDQNGDILWSKVYSDNISSPIGGYSVSPTDDGGFAVTGRITDLYQDLLCMKTDASGNIQWANRYANPNSNFYSVWGNSIKQTYDGGYIVGASTYDLSIIDAALLLRLDPLGNFQWCRSYRPETGSDAICVSQALDSGFVFCGRSEHFTGQIETYFVKTDGTGNSGCFDSTFYLNQFNVNMQGSNSGNYFSVPMIGSTQNTVVMNLSPGITTFCQTNDIPGTPGQAFRIYPNPAREKVVLELSGLKVNSIRWVNLQGVKSEADYKNTENRNLEMNCSGFPPGVYILELNSDRGVRYFRIVKI